LQRYLIISQLRPEPSTTGIRSARGDEWRKSGRGEKYENGKLKKVAAQGIDSVLKIDARARRARHHYKP